MIVRNALVLGTSSNLPAGNSGSTEKSVQLRLTDAEANVVFWMQEHGAWWLMLRPVVKPRNTTFDQTTAQSIMRYLKKHGWQK